VCERDKLSISTMVHIQYTEYRSDQIQEVKEVVVG